MAIYTWPRRHGLSHLPMVAATPRSARIWFTESAFAGYNYPYDESPQLGVSRSPENSLIPFAAGVCYAALRPHYMRNTSRTLVINLLFTILKSSEGKNHEDPNPNYGLA